MILVAGVGNIFFGDDAFGSDVARRMSGRSESPREAADREVRVIDFGIRALDLTYALCDGYEAVIIIDTFAQGGAPGTIYVVEPESSEFDNAPALIEAHGMHVGNVLAAARSMGAPLTNIWIVGCEPQTFGPDEGVMGLSAPVAAAVEPAIQIIESLIDRLFLKEAIV